MENSLILKKRNATSTRESSTQMMLIAGKAQQEKIADLRSQVSITQMILFVGVSIRKANYFQSEILRERKGNLLHGI